MSSNQEKFLKRIRTALGHEPDTRREMPELFPDQPSTKSAAALDRIRRRDTQGRKKLLSQMMEAAKPLNLEVTPVADEAAARTAVVDRVCQKSPEWDNQNQVCAWRHPLIDALELGPGLEVAKIPFYVVDSVATEDVRAEIRRNIVASYIGITSADFVMADTAALVMRTRAGQPRSAAVVPSIHIAVVKLEQILADLQELYALLRWDEKQWDQGLSNYMSFISGPSKTADIEATMVHGAHGPREVHIIVIARDND